MKPLPGKAFISYMFSLKSQQTWTGQSCGHLWAFESALPQRISKRNGAVTESQPQFPQMPTWMGSFHSQSLLSYGVVQWTWVIARSIPLTTGIGDSKFLESPISFWYQDNIFASLTKAPFWQTGDIWINETEGKESNRQSVGSIVSMFILEPESLLWCEPETWKKWNQNLYKLPGVTKKIDSRPGINNEIWYLRAWYDLGLTPARWANLTKHVYD